MPTLTLEQVRAKIRRNYDPAAKPKPKTLQWNRETMHTMITSCGTYRIAKQEDPTNAGCYCFSLSLALTPTSGARHLCGPFLIPKDAREAAQRHADGLPLQADLA
jgi:hypothetical protein